MANEDLYKALKNADKAGDTEAAKKIASYIQSSQSVAEEKPKRSFGQELVRQGGLTLRAGLEGAGETIGIFSDPIAATMNMAGANTVPAGRLASNVADTIGLPKPEGGLERGVNTVSKLLVGTGGTMKAAGMGAKSATGAVKEGLTALTANPGAQASSAIGAGAAGELAKESGAGPIGQTVAAVAGGVALPALTSTLGRAANATQLYLTPTDVEGANNAIKQAQVNVQDLPSNIQKSLVKDVAEALKSGKSLSPDAIRRLADYKATGLTPMRSNLTLNPADVTREQNLTKMSANSRDPAAQRLANNKNANNTKLIANLNEMGAADAADPVNAANKIIQALEARNTSAKNVINQRYATAKDSAGRSAKIDSYAFHQKANQLLDDNLRGGKLPSDVRNLLNQAASGDLPLTVDVAEQLKTRIGDLQRASRDGAERLALGDVRKALDDAPLLEGQGREAIDAFNKARRVNRAYMSVVEKTPALAAVRDGIEPDKFVSKFITGGNATISDLTNLRKAVKQSPEAMNEVRGQIVSHLKNKALNGASDEIGNFSHSAFNKSLKDIGDHKLGIFFDKKEIDALKALGRVASYENVQPKGSAVNNSNTAATAFTAVLDKIADSGLLRKIPIAGEAVANSAQSISTGITSRSALNVPKALQLEAPKAGRNVPIALGLAAGQPGND